LFLGEIPRTSTGKFKKLELRARYGDYLEKRAQRLSQKP
jgi:acyl-CoA synthetase (AMP-forming)/AMP-acid ligase II